MIAATGYRVARKRTPIVITDSNCRIRDTRGAKTLPIAEIPARYRADRAQEKERKAPRRHSHVVEAYPKKIERQDGGGRAGAVLRCVLTASKTPWNFFSDRL